MLFDRPLVVIDFLALRLQIQRSNRADGENHEQRSVYRDRYSNGIFIGADRRGGFGGLCRAQRPSRALLSVVRYGRLGLQFHQLLAMPGHGLGH